MTVTDLPAAPPDSIDCRLLQVLAVIDDERRCRAVTDLLLDRARRRWSGRDDCAHFPPLRRWRAVESGYLGADVLPADIIGAVAAGHVPDTRDLAQALRTMLVLHSGCPARVQPIIFASDLSVVPPHGVLLSIYGLEDDDLRLAEALVEACVSVGALTELERFARWLPVPLAGARTATFAHPPAPAVAA
ncbi:hypothetical protein [Nocardia cyriacigeorgica]|uniref:hypothetical protein n=1 Tax=Nocardia cyriacigeorgica TaxID=135487 RepID=UPI002453FDC8|nr:hypothetical protein [Nocardia cyriacigeorgica]